MLSLSLFNLGTAYYNEKHYELSLKYVEESLEYFLEKQYRKREATKKADAIAIISRDIYRKMIFGNAT